MFIYHIAVGVFAEESAPRTRHEPMSSLDIASLEGKMWAIKEELR
jgi:hypothetical protein